MLTTRARPTATIQNHERNRTMTAKKVSTKKSDAEAGDVATLLAKVFAHPDLPYAVWVHIADALCEMDESFDKYKNPAVMREVLNLHAKQEAERKKGGAR